jgi:DNA-binding MarR family transcriptional regulator
VRLEQGVVAWLRLARVFARLETRSQRQLRTAGLTGAQFDVLAQVGAREGCTQQELADSLLVTKGNVTQLLDRMEECGWLTRTQEGRTKRVCLTRAGRTLRRTVIREHEDYMAAQLAALSTEEQRTLARLLRTLERSLDESGRADEAGEAIR